MALSETDLHRIRLWARERVPEKLWGQVKVEADVSDRYVDIVEVGPPWNGVGEHAALADVRRGLPRSNGKDWSPEFFGIVEGADLPCDLATNTDDYLADSRFGRDSR